MEIKVTRRAEDARKPRPDDSGLGFGKYTTDHMFMMDYLPGRGWTAPRVTPYGELSLDPAAMVLHYNQEVFEGLKAYKLVDGGIGLFRPDKNIERMNRSARRMVMPEVDPDLFLRALKELILLDREWIPSAEGASLYIRPTMIANEPALGVRASERYLFYIIIGPVGAYYPGGFDPTRIYVTDEYVRAVRGGSGEAKTSCNYGPTLLMTKRAAEKGYNQILWLDALERKWVEEVGTSNIFLLFGDELVTPPLAGTILPGITRDSVIAMARKNGVKVCERPVSIQEVVEGCESGALKEAFASGTAAVISPVGEIGFQGRDFRVADGKSGELAQKIYRQITDIQYGRGEDPFGWLVRIA